MVLPDWRVECSQLGGFSASFQFPRRTNLTSWMTSGQWHSHHIWWRCLSSFSSASSGPKCNTRRIGVGVEEPSFTCYTEFTHIWINTILGGYTTGIAAGSRWMVHSPGNNPIPLKTIENSSLMDFWSTGVLMDNTNFKSKLRHAFRPGLVVLLCSLHKSPTTCCSPCLHSTFCTCL